MAKSGILIGVLWLMVGCQSGGIDDSLSAKPSTNASALALNDSTAQAIIGASFMALSDQLQMQVARHGVTGALAYCQVKALPLTDSLSTAFGISISRVAARNRNPLNALNIADEKVYALFEHTLAQGNQPEMTTVGNTVYAPILLQQGCVKCHGTVVDQIAATDYERILTHYPNDQAINFKPGDLRGMWKLEKQ